MYITFDDFCTTQKRRLFQLSLCNFTRICFVSFTKSCGFFLWFLTGIGFILFLLAVLRKIENVECKHKCDFLYDFWFYMKEKLKEELILYIKKNYFTDIFQKFCIEFKYTVFYKPSKWLFQNSLPDISNFLLGFVKAICCKFLSLYGRDNKYQRHSTS